MKKEPAKVVKKSPPSPKAPRSGKPASGKSPFSRSKTERRLPLKTNSKPKVSKTKNEKQTREPAEERKGRMRPEHYPRNKEVIVLVVKTEATLLSFVLEKMPHLGRNKIKGYLSRKQIAVNGVPVTQFDYPLARKDEVSIFEKALKSTRKQKIDIIYEDDDMVAINKPAGLLSVASDKEKGITAYRLVSDYVREDDARNRVYVVHRIDKETSGVLLFAKTTAMRDLLTDNWDKLVAKRGYFAVTIGVPEVKEQTLKNHLYTNATRLMYVGNKAKGTVLAITHYVVKYETEGYALLDVDISTGKKNQIRVQLKHIGHPLVGDEKYESGENPLKRLGLHAYALHVKHPVTNKELKLTAPMPKEFKTLFKI